MTPNLNLEACPTANVCVQTYMSGPLCGTESRHLPPLPLAEDLCLGALKGRLGLETSEPRIQDWRGRALKDLALGWQEAEIGMHPATPDRPPEARSKKSRNAAVYSEDHFDQSALHVDEVLKNRKRLFSDGVSAGQLLLYLPVLPLRRTGKDWSADDFTRIRFGVGSFVEPAQTANLHPLETDNRSSHPLSNQPSKHAPCFIREADRLNTLTQLGGQLLGLRAGLQVTPSSAREANGGYQAGYHRYYIPGETGKLPLRFGYAPQGEGRRSEAFSRNGLHVAFAGLAKVTAESLFPWKDLPSLTGRAITALSQEALLQPISMVDRLLLDGMTNLLRIKVQECSQNSDHPFKLKAESIAGLL